MLNLGGMRLAAGLAAAVLAATTVIAGPAVAQEPAPAPAVAGTTESTQAVLDLDVGSILDLELVAERATADVTDAPSALSTITGLAVASAVVPALNAAFPTVTAQQPGGASTDQESLSLGGALAAVDPSLAAAGSVIDGAGVIDGDVLNLGVGAQAEGQESAATGATELVRLAALGGVLDVSGVTSALVQGTAADAASVSRTMHVNALGVLDLGSLFELLGVPLPSLGLADLGTLALSLGVAFPGVPGGSTLPETAQPLLDTLDALRNDPSATVGSLTTPVQGVIASLLGSAPASDTVVEDLPGLPTLVSDLVTQVSDLLSGGLGVLADTSLVRLDAIDLSAAVTAVGRTEGSHADANCALGSVQIGALPPVDLGGVTSAVGQAGPALAQLPFGLGEALELSVCGQPILGGAAPALVESVAMAGEAVEAHAEAAAIHLGVHPGAALQGLAGGTPVASLFGSAGGLGLPELPAIAGVVDLDALLGGGNVLAEGLTLDVGRVTARATYQAVPVAVPPASLPSTGSSSTLPLLAALVLLPLALVGRRFLRERAA